MHTIHPHEAFIPPLNGVKRGQAVNIAIFHIKGLDKTLRKYDFIVVLKWGRPDLYPKWAH